MKTFRFFAASLLLAPAFVRAAEVQPYHAKNRSQFAVQMDAHDPFWPVGYVHQDRPAGQKVAAVVELKASQFEVSSITMFGKERLAVINQKVFGVGEFVPVQISGQKTSVQVVAIGDGAVVLQFQDQRLQIPLRRDNLAKLTPADAAPTLASPALPVP